MKPRKHNYVVGYKGESQCAYGKELWIDLLTLNQAQRRLKRLISGAPKAIYKLVEVRPKKKAAR